MRLSKRLWYGVLVAALGSGGAGIKHYLSSLRETRSAPAHGTPRSEAKPAPRITLPESVPEAVPAVAARPRLNLDEPIVAHMEELETDSELPAEEPLPMLGGAGESDVLATQAPRPDEEPRRMPYADEVLRLAARR